MDDIGGGAREMGSRGASTPWQPIQLVFKRYFPHNIKDERLCSTVKKKAVSSALTRTHQSKPFFFCLCVII